MSRVLELAKEIKAQSKSLYGQFKAEGNVSYMKYMRIIFDSAEQVRYALEEESQGFVSPDAWMAMHVIMHIGVRREDYSEVNEALVLPLYEKFSFLEQSYKRAYDIPDHSLKSRHR